MQGFHDLSLSQANQSNTHHNIGDQSDLSSLSSQIGQDNSINCLLQCSRYDIGSVASLNRSFHSLIRGGKLYRLRRQLGIVEHWVYFSCNLLQWEALIQSAADGCICLECLHMNASCVQIKNHWLLVQSFSYLERKLRLMLFINTTFWPTHGRWAWIWTTLGACLGQLVLGKSLS